MKGRVTVTVELYDTTDRANDEVGGQTLRWGRGLNDDNPSFSAPELEKALTAGTAVLVSQVTRLRGNAAIGEHIINPEASKP